MSTKIIFHQQLAAVTDSSFQKNLPILEWLVTKLFQKYSKSDVRKCGDGINFISTTRSVESQGRVAALMLLLIIQQVLFGVLEGLINIW